MPNESVLSSHALINAALCYRDTSCSYVKTVVDVFSKKELGSGLGREVDDRRLFPLINDAWIHPAHFLIGLLYFLEEVRSCGQQYVDSMQELKEELVINTDASVAGDSRGDNLDSENRSTAVFLEHDKQEILRIGLELSQSRKGLNVVQQEAFRNIVLKYLGDFSRLAEEQVKKLSEQSILRDVIVDLDRFTGDCSNNSVAETLDRADQLSERQKIPVFFTKGEMTLREFYLINFMHAIAAQLSMGTLDQQQGILRHCKPLVEKVAEELCVLLEQLTLDSRGQLERKVEQCLRESDRIRKKLMDGVLSPATRQFRKDCSIVGPAGVTETVEKQVELQST